MSQVHIVTKIYIVVESGGEYEDAWRGNLVAFNNRASAEAYIANSIAEHEKHAAQQKSLYEHFKAWEAKVPPVDYTPYASIKPPRWPSGIKEKDITPEMRAERKRILAENIEKDQRYNEAMNARMALWYAEYVTYMERLDLTPLVTTNYYATIGSDHVEETDFSIEEIDLLST